MKRLFILFALLQPAIAPAQDSDTEFQTEMSAQENSAPPNVSMLRSYNAPELFVRHRSYLGEVAPIPSASYAEDAAFRVINGLADPNKVSFESVNFPGYYLRHRDWRVRLHLNDGTQLFNEDATFARVPGRADPSWSSFESHNYPGKFLRHRKNELWVETGHGETFRNSATFMVQPANLAAQDEVQPAAAGESTSSCDFSFRSFCYAVERTVPQTYMQAEQSCVDQYGGHLASIHSQPENDFVGALVDPGRAGDVTAWIGAFAPVGFVAKEKATYRWSDGTPWGYNKWRTGTSEPNGTPRGSPAGIQFYPGSSGELSGWNDVPQSETLAHAVCKWPAEKGPSSQYKLYGNAQHAGFPWIDSEIGVITLIPEDAYSASGVAFMKESAPVPFVLSFEFKTWDRDGGKDRKQSRYSADGISVIFATDDSDYESRTAPAGFNRGFFNDGSALALGFNTYDKRKVILSHGYLVLESENEPDVYTDGAWQKVRIEVNPDGIVVLFDDRAVLYWRGNVPLTQPHVAFGAGTGASNSLHMIRNVVLE